MDPMIATTSSMEMIKRLPMGTSVNLKCHAQCHSYSIAHSNVFFYIQSEFSCFFAEILAQMKIDTKNHVSFDKIHGSITQRRKTMI